MIYFPNNNLLNTIMRPDPCQLVRTSAVVLLTFSLFGCGGGGGSSATTTAPGPVAESPLLVNASNARTASVLAFGMGGVALALGQLAVDWTAQADRSATLSFSRACADGGTASATLADRDGDHHASAGDQLTVTLAGCYLKELDDTMDGTVTVALTAPGASQQRAGVVTFTGFKVRGSSPSQEITGAVRFDYSAGRLSKVLHAYSDTQPFGITFSDAAKSSSETVTALDVLHETRPDTVRATTTMRLHLASNLLGGSVDLATPTPWSAWFDTYPDAGESSVTGAGNSKASLRARAARSSFDVLLAGAPVDQYPADGMGVLWTGAPWLPAVAAAGHYATAQIGEVTDFRSLLQPDPAQFVPHGTLQFIYSRPLDPLSITGATFIQTSGASNTLPADIPATVTVDGGLVTATPSTQLVPGAGYELRFSGGYGLSIHDTGGNMLSIPSFAGTVVQTVGASLVAGGAPVLLGSSATLVLDAGGSTANGTPVASTHWRQLSGPQLSFSDPNAARVTVAPAGATNGTAVVELEVANAAGDVDRKQISLTVAGDIAQAFVITASKNGAPMTVATNFDPSAGGYVTASQGNTVLDVLLSPQRFLAGLTGGQTWQTGLQLTYGRGNTSGVTGSGWLGCIGSSGSFSVLDYALDASGNVTRLALDVDDTCDTTVTRASIRYHSTLPVRQ